ncbi:uncharacterized protein LOC124373308 [Homalodisca vitripennis]|uniref:uncharacterized protein LOC124373308 n=1 Tax=Homalodisca vitripennis TaxID=197043 RepID=UPI001EE9D8F4|nr:uncharacterized protein LOC124373308 [Homalodisca vitripennis]
MVSPSFYGGSMAVTVALNGHRFGQANYRGVVLCDGCKDYRPAVLGLGTDQRSPGPAEYLRGKVEGGAACDNANNTLADDAVTSPTGTSPKLRLKFHRFWSGNVSNNGKPARAATVDDSMNEFSGQSARL